MRFLFLNILIYISFVGYTQTDTTKIPKRQFPAISANYALGNIIPTTDFVRGDNQLGRPLTKYQSASIKMLWQNPGYTDWQKIYHVPYYGVGVAAGDFHNPDEIGNPISVYGILGIPVKRWNRLELYSEFQFGIAANWKHYDSISNPKNMVIGGGMTVHLNIGFNAFYQVTKNIDLGAGISFIHFSNGGFERPNRGFNIYAPSVELKYYLNNRPDVRPVKPAGRLERSNDLYLMAGYGDYQPNDNELSKNYFAAGGLSAIYFTQLSNAFRVGAGADLNYWFGLNARNDGSPGPQNHENFTLGLVVHPEFILNKLSLVSGFGIYAHHLKYGNFKQTYQRLGVRYEFYNNASFGVNIRAINFMLAEFLEFNVGYRFRWKK
jgi:hypothetical protein